MDVLIGSTYSKHMGFWTNSLARTGFGRVLFGLLEQSENLTAFEEFVESKEDKIEMNWGGFSTVNFLHLVIVLEKMSRENQPAVTVM